MVREYLTALLDILNDHCPNLHHLCYQIPSYWVCSQQTTLWGASVGVLSRALPGGRRLKQASTVIQMSEEISSSDGDASTVEPRTYRARTEEMTVSLRKIGGIYSVRGESGNVYRVDICRPACTCLDQQKSSTDRCKHLQRVEVELRNRTVPTSNGRLPSRSIANGGIGPRDRDNR